MNPAAVNGRSVGLFQQQGALYAEVDRTDPEAAFRAFYQQLVARVPNYTDPASGTFADIAQAVQRSGAGAGKYAGWERWATELAAHLVHHAEVPDPRIDTAREASVSCYRKALRHFDIHAENVRIPFAGTTLPGYFYAPHGDRRATVVIHNGFDGTGDECWFMGGKAAADRGYNVLAFEGPGQGEVLHRQGLVFRPDWENVVSPVLDYVTTRPEVDPTRIALIGISMGGILAPRAAAYDSRIAALIAFDGVFDMFEFALDQVPLPRDEATRRLLAPHDPELDALLADVIANNPLARWSTDHGQWAFGTTTPRTFLAALHDYHLRDGIAERITCPTLVLKSEIDFAFTGQPEQLHEHLTCPKALVPFTSAEGAGAHCQVGAMTLACARIYDWLDNVLAPTSR